METLDTTQKQTAARTAWDTHIATRKVPTLSLAAYTMGSAEQRVTFIQNLWKGLKDYGFIILKDHGVSAELQKKAYDLLEQFYALPLETKMKYISPAGGGQRGYTPFGQEHAKDSPVMDLKEFWHVGREVAANHPMAAHYPANIWPTELPEFQTVFSALFTALEEAGKNMLEALTGPLRLEKDYFKVRVQEGNSILRLLHYPPIPEGVDPRCLRAAPHEDINFITLLPAATASGLQLKDRDGSWLDVDGEPGTLIVDVGDMLARLTNDVLPSTTHQVVNTPEGRVRSRYSMPFFMHPQSDVSLACLPSCQGEGEKYAPITAGEFLMQRLREIGLIK
ncbi:MAG: isopenicillin N synthase family dioxygenase [Bdellovibrionales bacterium]